jgi:gliding motility-associated-like protein
MKFFTSKKAFLVFCISFVATFLPELALASHIRGGEITARRRPGAGFAYDFTLTVYTDIGSNVDDPENVLYFGDGTFQTSNRASVPELLPGVNTNKNIYLFSHTYAAPGQYLIFHTREYRNNSVLNIGATPGAVSFYVETNLLIAPALDASRPNSSPILDAFAVDIAALGQVYLHNPAAYDVDGDSLSFQILPSRNWSGVSRVEITNYQFPEVFAGGRDSANSGPATLTINPRNGLMRWDVPNREGEYNVAILIQEWRFGIIIGYVVRDMQIIVKDVDNRRPILQLPADTCVFANSRITKRIRATDPDVGDSITLTSYGGGVYQITPVQNRALFLVPRNRQASPAFGTYSWQPGCGQVRRQPYDVSFKAADFKPGFFNFQPLVDIRTWSIKVIGPPPTGLTATVGLGSVQLTWDSYICPNITGFNIYRRVDSSLINADTCQTGVPANEGFTFIGTSPNNARFFLDDNNGQGLRRGYRYCYRITAQYEGGNPVESRESDQVCAQLKLDLPLHLNVDVTKTDTNAGEIFVRWSKPSEIDTLRFPGPYRYQLIRYEPTGERVLVFTSPTLNDTIFTDSNLNTVLGGYRYQVVFNFLDISGRFYRDSADAATMVTAFATGGVNLITTAITYTVLIYRGISPTALALYDSVAGGTRTYTDIGKPGSPLEYQKRYFYYLETQGRYSANSLPFPLKNKSQIVSARTRDTIRPCPPQDVRITNQNINCPTCADYLANPNRANTLTWNPPTRDSCALDLRNYIIYFKPRTTGAFNLLATTTDTFFVHNNGGNVAGCYKVTIVDSSANESIIVDSVCNDNCVYFELPNIFTPEVRDEKNDYFEPTCAASSYIRSVNLKVYNRWGRLVYENADARKFQWDGIMLGGSKAPSDTYFYKAMIEYIRLRPEDERYFTRGWVELVR